MYMYYQNLSFGSIDFIMKILTGRYLFDSANGFIINTISTTKFPTYPVQPYGNSEQSSLDLLALDKVNFMLS